MFPSLRIKLRGDKRLAVDMTKNPEAPVAEEILPCSDLGPLPQGEEDAKHRVRVASLRYRDIAEQPRARASVERTHGGGVLSNWSVARMT
jgi:hypothetical protein